MNVDPVIVWFITGLVLMLLEFAVPGVILVFFGIAAWIVALTTYTGITQSASSQLILFSISTIALLVGLRKWVRNKIFVGHVSDMQDLNVDLDEFTGKAVTVLQDVAPGKPGKVEFKGADWNASSEDEIKAGEPAFIVSMDGLTLKIRKR